MRAKSLVILCLAGVLVAGAAGGGYLWYKQRKQAEAPKPAQQTAAPDVITLQATLRPVSIIEVGSPIEGTIDTFHADIGEEVYEGQLLAVVKNESAEADQQLSEAELEKHSTRVQNLESVFTAARLEASRAGADASRARSDLERSEKVYNREKLLIAEGATPRRTFENAEKAYLSAQEQEKSLSSVAVQAEERVVTVQRELDGARRILEQKSQDVEAAKARVGAGQVVAPASGIVVTRRGQAGERITPQVKDLFQIGTDMSKLEAVADVPPQLAAAVKQRQNAMVFLAEMPEQPLPGSIRFTPEGKLVVAFSSPNSEVKPGATAHIRLLAR